MRQSDSKKYVDAIEQNALSPRVRAIIQLPLPII